jgi:hypothetical protein
VGGQIRDKILIELAPNFADGHVINIGASRNRENDILDAESRLGAALINGLMGAGDSHSGNGMVFVGNFRHPPNREAVRWLAEQIVPQLPAELLHAHPIRVIGNRLDDEIAALCTQAGLAAVGWVPSLTPYLAQARVALVPLLNGAGTKCKLIQSLMIGTPSVATPIGAEGLAVRDGRDLLIAQDAAGFAAAVTRLLADETLWRLIRAQGRETVLQLHSLPLVQARFLAVVEQLTEHAASARAQQGW